MELFLFFLAVGLFLLAVFIREGILAKKQKQRFIQSLYEDFGTLPQKEYALERYARMGSFFHKHEKEGQIDDITWNDLNMDDIFKRLNYTFSASGEEYLYYTLRTPRQSVEELSHLEEVTEYFLGHPDERAGVQLLMRKLGYTGKFSLYDYLDNLNYLGKRSNARHYLMDGLFVPFLCILPFWYTVGICGIVVLILFNIISYFKEKNEIDPYITSFAYVMRLLTVCDGLLKIEIPPLKREWEEMERCKNGLSGMKRGSFWVFSSNRNASTGNPLDIVMDYIRMTFHVDLIKFNRMLSQLTKHLADVDSLITCVGYVETAIAIGAFRVSLGEEYCVPKLGKGEELVLEGAWHPMLSDPVKNSIAAERGVLLTGSNASGKSTFLKTVAVNAILAQTIHTCLAASYSAPFFHIYSSMSLRDDMKGGESYYIVEIKALKRILDAAERTEGKVLCFVDEVLRGTNTVERIAASTQILKSLTGSNILCFAATHDIEMTDLLRDFFDNYHFEEDIRDGDVFFNYRLMKGKAATRNAIKLLEIMGYEKEIIEKASRQAERFLSTGVWELA